MIHLLVNKSFDFNKRLKKDILIQTLDLTQYFSATQIQTKEQFIIVKNYLCSNESSNESFEISFNKMFDNGAFENMREIAIIYLDDLDDNEIYMIRSHTKQYYKLEYDIVTGRPLPLGNIMLKLDLVKVLNIKVTCKESQVIYNPNKC